MMTALADTTPDTLSPVLQATLQHVVDRAANTIGYPCARTDALFNWAALEPFTHYVINQLGDPRYTGPMGFTPHVHPLERDVLARAAAWFDAPEPYWGCMESSSSIAIGQGYRTGRVKYPDAVAYHSAAAHMSIPNWAEIVGMPSRVVNTHPGGGIDLDHFAAVLDVSRPAFVVANVGTLMTEACDDARGLTQILTRQGVPYHLHLDAALAGAALAVSPNEYWRERVSLRNLAHSINVSTHKLFGTPNPGAVFLARGEDIEQLRRPVSYLNCRMATIGTSRSGMTVVQMWHALSQCSDTQLHELAQNCRRTARWLVGELARVGVAAHRHKHGFTVWFPTPADEIMTEYGLPPGGAVTHVVCVPGISVAVLRRFVRDMAGAAR